MKPDGWRACSLGEVLAFLPGYAFPSSSFTSDPAQGLPLVRIRDLHIQQPDVFISISADPQFEVGRDDLLVGMDGDFEAARWRGPKALLNQRVCKLWAADRTAADDGFLYYRVQPELTAIHNDTGRTTVKHLSTRQLSVRRLLLPPLGEQRKIAAILSSVDDAIEATQAVINQLQVVKKAMIAELLTRGLPGRHTRFKQTEIGEVPESWEVGSLGTLLTGIDAGWSPQCEPQPAGTGEWGVLKISAVSWGDFRPRENKRLPSTLEPRPGLQVAVGDVLVSRSNTPELVGRSVLVTAAAPMLMLCDKIFRLRVNGTSIPAFIDLVLGTPNARAQIEEGASGSSGSMKNISQEKLRGLVVPIPSAFEQQCIADFIRSLSTKEESERQVVGGLVGFKSALMSVLLTGEVRVKPDEAVP